jgi:hypothetical protein
MTFTPPWRSTFLSVAAAAAVAGTLTVLAFAQPASAAAPYWKLSSRSAPTNLPLKGEPLVGANDDGVKGEGMLVVTAVNLGDANVNGTKAPVTITDQVPTGLEPTFVLGVTGQGVPGQKGAPLRLNCPQSFSENRVVCTFEGEAPPFEHLELEIGVQVTTSTPAEPINKVTVTGGDTKEAALEQPVKIRGEGGATPFGVEAYELTPENEDGSLDRQAGSHPFQLTTTFDLNQGFGFYNEFKRPLPQAPALQRNLEFRIPPGLLGNPQAVAQCSAVDFGVQEENSINACPDSTAIGVASVSFNDPILIGPQTWSVPVFNLVPAPGEPARFGFEFLHVAVLLDTSVRTGEDYGVTVSVRDAPQTVQVLGAEVTLWGVPGDQRHDNSRGWNCLGAGHWVEKLLPVPECELNEFPHPSPFLVLPTSCATPLVTGVSGTSWPDAEGKTQTLTARNEPPWARASQPVSLEGCDKLPFNPSIAVKPDTSSASTPSGMTVEVNMPLKDTTLASDKLAEGDIRSTRLELPEGVMASAGAADGLATCGTGETGFFGLPSDTQQVLQGELEAQRFTPAPASCPDAAKVGTVEVNTPLLPQPLRGSVYLGIQNTNPFASPLVLYIVATEEEPIRHEGSKVLIKLAGEVALDESTGRLTSRFVNTPQAPFEHLKIHLFDGSRASQSTPPDCGSYNAKADFTAWNEIAPETPDTASAGSEPGEGFQITSGPGGGACPAGALPFSPGLEAGSMNIQAGAFTQFTTTIGRPDGQQALQSITLHLPSGLAAMLASVTPCPASQTTCGPDSLIGHSTILAGLGPDPVTLHGQVYLTGPYKGAPFGLLAVTPDQSVGPFHLTGIPEVRSTITVDPNTAAATITSDSIPRIVKGVPSQIKTLNVTVDRSGFQFNPTNCNPLTITGTLAGYEGGATGVSYPFRAGNCASLPFKPKFTASVAGQASKANGTTFTVRVESGRGQANIAKTFLALPIALPSRLSTIQQACLATTFERNPATCPEGSNIGYAVAHTPVLKKALVGPAYLVSHGNAAFPDVEFILQSEGITIVLDGKTDIKKGITYSRFETLPDAPVETFETVLPAGPHSALTANVPESEHFNLCKHASELVIPTEITGQNGAVVKQQTKVALTGCVLGFKKESKLAKALKACRKKYAHNKKKRVKCERAARNKYGPKHKSSKKKK